MEELTQTIKRHEGLRLRVYKDSLGILHCGWGHKLAEGSPVSLEICEAFFKSDIAYAISDFMKLPLKYRRPLNTDLKRHVIVEMLFNLGLPKLLLFKKMWSAVEKSDWETVAHEMLASKWARQVGDRAIELAEKIRQ